jgi:hypothetical protein
MRKLDNRQNKANLVRPCRGGGYAKPIPLGGSQRQSYPYSGARRAAPGKKS